MWSQLSVSTLYKCMSYLPWKFAISTAISICEIYQLTLWWRMVTHYISTLHKWLHSNVGEVRYDKVINGCYELTASVKHCRICQALIGKKSSVSFTGSIVNDFKFQRVWISSQTRPAARSDKPTVTSSGKLVISTVMMLNNTCRHKNGI